jgi:hypothetical protein
MGRSFWDEHRAQKFFSCGQVEAYHLPQVEEQTVLDELHVWVVVPENYPCFQSLLRRHHYLQRLKPLGERLYYAAVWRGQWLTFPTAWNAWDTW